MPTEAIREAIVNAASYTASSYVFLTTADGTILVHPNDEYSLNVDSASTVQEANAGRYHPFAEENMVTLGDGQS